MACNGQPWSWLLRAVAAQEREHAQFFKSCCD
jgi:hypothetical protein